MANFITIWGLTLLHMPLRSFLLILLVICLGMIVKERAHPRNDIKIIAGVLLLLTTVLFYMLNPRVDLSLTRFETAFQRLEHPRDSQLIQNWTTVGVAQEGTYSGCNYFVAQLRASPQTMAQLRARYAQQSIPSAELQSSSQVPVTITSLKGLKNTLQLPIERVQIEPHLADHTLYVVWALDPHSALRDFRCL